MNKIEFFGSIWSGDYKVVAALLGDWLETTDLDIKIRISGEEIVYEDDRLYVYCYSALSSEGVPPSFLLEGHLTGTLDEAKARLQQMLQLCKERQIDGDFECVEVNEDGHEISDQFHIE